MRRLIDPPLDRMAMRLRDTRISPNGVTVAGFGFGLLAMLAVSLGSFWAGLALLLINRFADGLDGALARRRGITDLGGFLDIVLDFIIYSGIVFGFALADPRANALAAAFLIFSFIGTGCSFLAFAVMAARRNISSDLRGRKSLYYLGGLTEGTETVLFFVLICLLPASFPWLAGIFGALCWVTTIARILSAYRLLGSPD